MSDTPKKTIPMPMTSTRAPATPAPAADEPGSTPLYKSEKEAVAHSADPLPPPPEPDRRDPACAGAGKHLANCACTGDMRGPF